MTVREWDTDGTEEFRPYLRGPRPLPAVGIWRRERGQKGLGGTGVSRKVLTVNSFPGGMRLESARRGSAFPSPRSPSVPTAPSSSSFLVLARRLRSHFVASLVRRHFENRNNFSFETHPPKKEKLPDGFKRGGC